MTESAAPSSAAVGTREWVRRRGPSWVLEAASALSAVVGIAQGAHGIGDAACWVLVALEGGLLVATASVLWRMRRVLRARLASGARTPAPAPRRAVRVEGLVGGVVLAFAGLDAIYTYRPRAVGLAVLFLGAQLLYDRFARR